MILMMNSQMILEFRQMNVTDVNDNPPFLAEPQEVQVTENSEPQEVAQVKLGDPDDWRKGHGPPFTITLDPRAPPHIAANVRVTLDKRKSQTDRQTRRISGYSASSPLTLI